MVWRVPSCSSMGLRIRLIVVLVIPLVLVVGVYGLVRVRQHEAQLLREDRRQMAVTARAIRVAVENALRDRQTSDVRRLLAEMVDEQDQIDGIRLFDRELRPGPASTSSPAIAAALEAMRRQVIETGDPEALFERHDGQPVLHYLVPLRTEQGAIIGGLEIVHRASAVDQEVRAAIWDVWIRLALVIVAVTGLSWVVLQRQVLRPLFRLAEGIQRFGEGQAGPPLPVERPDELGRVATAFNRMADQLEAARLKLVSEAERTLDLEQQIRQAETLAVAGKLASGLAHEVGTPLNIVSARAEFLRETLAGDDERRRDLDVIVEQIDRISGIIRSLLDTVRPQKPEVQPTALGRALDRLLPLLQHSAKRGGVALAVSIPADLPPVLADPGHLQQLLINLVMNALEATAAGGQVRVSARRETHRDRAGVAVTVSDTGVGIAPELHRRVFEPFFSTKPRGQGTGLGLAICRDIVREHGGDIRVESHPGAGAAFTCWLPEPEPTLP
jgi:two-component system NtrC family sensor kinase